MLQFLRIQSSYAHENGKIHYCIVSRICLHWSCIFSLTGFPVSVSRAVKSKCFNFSRSRAHMHTKMRKYIIALWVESARTDHVFFVNRISHDSKQSRDHTAHQRFLVSEVMIWAGPTNAKEQTRKPNADQIATERQNNDPSDTNNRMSKVEMEPNNTYRHHFRN